MIEEWRDIESTGNLLQVTANGRVRRKDRPLIYKDGRSGTLPAAELRPTMQAAGYVSASFGGTHLLIHRLVAEAFLPAPEQIFAKQTVNHKNGIKHDNRVENLEWASYKQNNDHARATGLNNQHGEQSNLAKHSDQFIQAVRNVYEIYKPNYVELGKIFGLRSGHVGQIIKGETRVKKTR